jgi:nucleoside-diphosphate-sugar epimerase
VLALTGGTGFIGSALARRLSASGCRIRALARSSRNTAGLTALGVEIIIGDLSERETLRRLLHGVDAVVHCAGAVRGRSLSDFNRVNVDGVARLAEIASMQQEPPRFLLLSSLAARMPFLSQYAASKRSGEEILRLIAGDRMEWAALRPPAVYGPGDRELLPLLHCMAHGIGPELGPVGARFSMLYVDDLAVAVDAWLGTNHPVSSIFELHDGRANGYSWEEARQIVAALRDRKSYPIRVPGRFLDIVGRMSLLLSKLSGRTPMLSPGKVRELTHSNWVCDNTAFIDATGWTPRVQLAEGVDRTLRQRM